jgi:hypothetical protein
MSVDDELQEHAEHAREPFDKKVAATMAVIAAALAIVSVLGQHFTTEELLSQQRASDLWSEYQGKRIRGYASSVASDVFATLKSPEMAKKYAAGVAHYDQDGKETQDKAREFEQESKLTGAQAVRLHMGEVFLEIGIVFASLAILSRRPALWLTGMVAGLAGAAIALTTLTLR